MTVSKHRYRAGSGRLGVALAGGLVVIGLVLAAIGSDGAIRGGVLVVAALAVVVTIVLWERLGRRSVTVEPGAIRLDGFGATRRCALGDVRLLSVARYTNRVGTDVSVVLWAPTASAGRVTGAVARLGLDAQSRSERRRVEAAEGAMLAPFVVPLSGLDADGVRAVVGAVAPLDSTGELQRRGVVSASG